MVARGEEYPVEHRTGSDRRKGKPALFSGLSRRRKPGRRADDRVGYVDVYDLRTWLVTAAILTLSLLVGVLTGIQLHHGRITEANPLMRTILDHGGIYPFLGVKAMLTALPLAVIILHKNWALGRRAARMCLWSYILVSLYHIYLVMRMPL